MQFPLGDSAFLSAQSILSPRFDCLSRDIANWDTLCHCLWQGYRTNGRDSKVHRAIKRWTTTITDNASLKDTDLDKGLYVKTDKLWEIEWQLSKNLRDSFQAQEKFASLAQRVCYT